MFSIGCRFALFQTGKSLSHDSIGITALVPHRSPKLQDVRRSFQLSAEPMLSWQSVTLQSSTSLGFSFSDSQNQKGAIVGWISHQAFLCSREKLFKIVYTQKRKPYSCKRRTHRRRSRTLNELPYPLSCAAPNLYCCSNANWPTASSFVVGRASVVCLVDTYWTFLQSHLTPCSVFPSCVQCWNLIQQFETGFPFR